MRSSSTCVQTLVHYCVLGLLLTVATQACGKSRVECEHQFKAERGQSGKDVVWIPTSDELVVDMLKMADVTAADRVYDLGSGDGKIAIAAAKQFGARAVGIEYNEGLAKLGACFAEAEGVTQRVRIVQGDIFESDFSNATVVTLYLLPELNLRLRPTLLKMPPGTRVVSHSFLMDDWQPDDRLSSEDGQAYLWIVPANVAGSWVFRQSSGTETFPVKLQQSFQHIEGTGGKAGHALTQAQLRGTQINLAFSEDDQPVTIDGNVNRDRIEARVTRGGKISDYIGTRR